MDAIKNVKDLLTS